MSEVTEDDGAVIATKQQASEALLVQGIRTNAYLEYLDLGCIHCLQEYPLFHFYTDLNRRARRYDLLRRQHELPPSFWCLLFAKFNRDKSVVFYFLRELPLVLAAGSGGNPRNPAKWSCNPATRKRRKLSPTTDSEFSFPEYQDERSTELARFLFNHIGI